MNADDWLPICRAMRDGVRAAVAAVPRDRRADELGRGAGGDTTVAVDQAAEDAAFAILIDLASTTGDGFTVVSEEVGERTLGKGGPWRVVIDPVDGSLNAKRGLPLYAFSVAIADGPAMQDVQLGYVHDLGNGEEWIARRGRGATVDGAPLGTARPLERLQLVALEATRPEHLAPAAAAMPGEVER
ncbi:MAG TPA: inositol monophosphatase family protein, partial [Gaiellales bacterium]